MIRVALSHKCCRTTLQCHKNHIKSNAARGRSSLQYIEDKRSVVSCHCAGNDDLNKKVLSSQRKATSDGASRTNGGREFQALTAATANARSPIVERRVDGTISSDVSVDRR